MPNEPPRRNMYDRILEGIFHARGIEGDERRQGEHIDALKPVAQRLFEAYRVNDVSPNYKDRDTQDCYLLRYYPAYTQLLLQELERLEESDNLHFDKKKRLTASFFGCGPAPELAGLLQFLQHKGYRWPELITANLYDIKSGPWRYASGIVEQHVLTAIRDKRLLRINPIEADLTSADKCRGKNPDTEKIAESHLVVFQYVLNEIAQDKVDQALDSIEGILSHVPPESIVVFIDQPMGLYVETTDVLMRGIEELASHHGFDVISKCQNDAFDARKINERMPRQIKNNLFFLPHFLPNPPPYGMLLRVEIKYSP